MNKKRSTLNVTKAKKWILFIEKFTRLSIVDGELKIRFYEENEQHLQWVLVDEVHVAINQWSCKVLNLIQVLVFRIQWRNT